MMHCVDRLDVAKEMAEFGMSAAALARLARLNEEVVRAYLDGRRELTWPAQFRLVEVLNALTQLDYVGAAPKDFDDVDVVSDLIAPLRVHLAREDDERFRRVIGEAGEATRTGG